MNTITLTLLNHYHRNYIIWVFEIITTCMVVIRYSSYSSQSIITTCNGSGLIITGIIEGDLPGQYPKAIELYALPNISNYNLSSFGVGVAQNGDGSDGEEVSFSEFILNEYIIVPGDFIYVTATVNQFYQFFGNSTNVSLLLQDSDINFNGNDAIELFYDNNVIDIFGDINQDGLGTNWEYTDGWAYRNDQSGPDGNIFNINNWYFSGIDVLDDITKNTDASIPFPIGTYKLKSDYPTTIPTQSPTIIPTDSPSLSPTQPPTMNPSQTPTVIPTSSPSATPTQAPTVAPFISTTKISITSTKVSTTATKSTLKPETITSMEPTSQPIPVDNDGSSNGGSNGLSEGLLIVIIICGTVVIVALIALVGVIYVKKSKHRNDRRRSKREFSSQKTTELAMKADTDDITGGYNNNVNKTPATNNNKSSKNSNNKVRTQLSDDDSDSEAMYDNDEGDLVPATRLQNEQNINNNNNNNNSQTPGHTEGEGGNNNNGGEGNIGDISGKPDVFVNENVNKAYDNNKQYDSDVNVLRGMTDNGNPVIPNTVNE